MNQQETKITSNAGWTLTRRGFFLAAGAASAAWGKGGGIKVGLQANGFPIKQGDYAGLVKSLPVMKELGYVGFECNYRFLEPEFERAAATREVFAQSGVKFIGAHASMEQMRGAAGERIAAGVAAMGGECIVMSGRGLSPAGQFEEPALVEKAKTLEELGRMLQKHKLALAYHNHNPEFANHNAEVNGLAAKTDPKLVSFFMDAGHGYLGGGNPAAFLTANAKRIFGIHLKTFKGKETSGQVPLGQGDFDFQDLAAAVKKTKWTGWLLTEEGGGPRGGNTAALGPDRDYILKMFGV